MYSGNDSELLRHWVLFHLGGVVETAGEGRERAPGSFRWQPPPDRIPFSGPSVVDPERYIGPKGCDDARRYREGMPAHSDVSFPESMELPPSAGSGDSPRNPGEGSGDAPAVRRDRTIIPGGPRRLAILVALTGLAITGLVAWTASSLNNDSENRLLNVQTQQAAEVLVAAIPTTETPLETGAQIAGATDGDVATFTDFVTPYVGTGRQFISASLWEVTSGQVMSRAMVGVEPALAVPSAQANALAMAARHSPSFAVTGILDRSRPRLGYAVALPGGTQSFVVYGERAIPADRQAAVASNSVFADLNYAIFLGGTATPRNLLTTSFAKLPVAGRSSMAVVPFGNTHLTLVAAPVGQLGGTLSERLPWIFLVLGVLLTVIATWITQRLVTSRQAAERDTHQIQELYGQLGLLYAEQRGITETLQRALLPPTRPSIPGLDVAVRYVPGARGVDVGGDWYSAIAIDARYFAFVIGDVSGRGIKAAAIMAALRFTIRALVLEGHSPSDVLDRCAKQVPAVIDDHFATVLVGVGDLERREISLANAGHLEPLLVTTSNTEVIRTDVGVPLGVPDGSYRSVTVTLPPRATVIAYTDGLIERRNENIDVGVERLTLATRGEHRSVDGLLTKVLAELAAEDSDDDIAVVAFRILD